MPSTWRLWTQQTVRLPDGTHIRSGYWRNREGTAASAVCFYRFANGYKEIRTPRGRVL